MRLLAALGFAAALLGSAGPAFAWGRGDAKSWAMESFLLSRKDAYALAAKPTCNDRGSVGLSAAYQVTAQRDAAKQLEKAGVRMAILLNRAL